MQVEVLQKDLVSIDDGSGCIYLEGEKQIRELIKMLTNALFQLKEREREDS